MHSSALRFVCLTATVAFLGGCYEEMPASPPQAQKSQPPATPQTADTATATHQGNAGDGVTARPATSGALAGGKRAAENIIQQAEDSSARTAEQADE